jgi:hypothetical protein
MSQIAFHLATETIQGLALTLESIDDVHGGHSLATSVFSVGDAITDDVFKEDLEDTASLFVNEARDTLDTTATSETTDSRLGNTLDVVAKDLAMTLGSSLSESFASFSTA